MIKTKGYAAHSAASLLVPHAFERHALRAHEVHIEVLFCGICHSDIHSARNEWKNTFYPIVPGHELVGRVVAVGDQVKSFAIDDIVGVGPLIGSCEKCLPCKEKQQQYCKEEFIEIYNSVDDRGEITKGGYATCVVIDQRFVFHIPEELLSHDLASLAPLFCAGVTVYSPLRHWNIGKNHVVGVVGIGGLGHLAVKIAKAMGAHVIAFTSTPWKVEDAKRLGADEAILVCDDKALREHEFTCDFIMVTSSSTLDLEPYLHMLKNDGRLCLIGIPSIPHPACKVETLVFGRKSIVGSVVGSADETREFLDFCAKHAIVADVEVVKAHDVNECYERVLQRQAKYRFVIDTSSL